MKITTWLVFFISFIFTAESFAQTPFIPKYNAIKRSERCFTITRDAGNQFGAVWFRDKGDFSSDTTLYFVMYFGNKDGNGADGFGFVIHDDPRDTLFDGSVTFNVGGQTFNQEAATGEPGGGLGFGDHKSQGQNLKITPSVAIEFDTWENNEDAQDGKADGPTPASPYKGWDHTAVVYNGDMYNGRQTIENPDGSFDKLAPLAPIAAPQWGPNYNVEDNGCYAFKIEWTVNNDGTQTLEMYADEYDPDIVDAENYDYYLIMRHTDDMINGVFGGETTLRFGFTGSTGGSMNEQTVCLLGGNTRPTALDDFASTPINTPVVIDVESNDQDFDGDNLFVPTIVQQAANGFAVVTSVGNDNFIQYTPNANFVGTDTVKYRTCDVDSDKCYALCDEADVIITVGCNEIFIGANVVAPYSLCADSLAANGAAEAFFVSGTAMGNVWVETFSNMNNATSDTGTTPWSFTTNGGCNSGNNIRVQSDAFRAQNTGCEVIWESGPIDISAVTNVSISVYLAASGDMESSDYLNAVYILDTDPEVPLTNGSFTDNFGSATASASGLNGTTLRIRIYAKNSAGDENYYWDDIYIMGQGPAAPPALTYNWYEGSVTPGNFVNSGSTITGLSDTTYYVVAVDPSTGCTSDTVSVTIPSVIPTGDTVLIEQISPFTRCELPYDGALGAYVVEADGDTVTNGYLFEWRLQSNPGSPPIRVGPLADNLDVQDYRVTVYSQATGCLVGSASDSLINEVRIPVVTPTVLNDVYSCVTDNGSVSATATKEGIPLTNNIGFLWYNGLLADIANPPDFVGSTISNLAPGDYAVLVIDSTTMCTSESQNVNVQDLRQLPVPVVTNATDQISCDSNAPTGSFTSAVNAGGPLVTAGFTFNWYRGLNNIIPARAGYTAGPDVDSLTADLYRLIVTNDTSGCQGVLDTAIIENIVNPAILDVDSTDVTICGGSPNGSITITPDGNIADFSYQYYTGNGVVPGNLITESASNTLTGLDVGTYTVTIVDNVTRCVSPARLIEINDATVIPTATFNIIPQYNCAPALPSGSIETTVAVGTPSDYTFEWFANNTSGAPVTSTRGINGEILDTLAVGTYALRLTNNATQCQNVYFNVISPDITLPVVDTAYAVASTFCGPAANGELHALADNGSNDPLIFTFEWSDAATSALVATGADALNIAPGDYELVITNDTTLCLSNPYPVRVIDSTVTPDPTLLASDNSSCDPTIANGSIEVTDVPNEPLYGLNDYTYIWTDNASGDTLTAVSGPNGETVDSLFQGTYRLTIINDVTTCENQVLSNITDINIKPIINTVSVLDHAVNCSDPFMSRIAVTSISLIDGTPGDTANFDFEWTNLDLASTLLETDALLFDNLVGGDSVPAGNYQVIASNSFGCESEPVAFVVQNVSVLPTMTLTPYPNSSCDPVGNPNGVITATPGVGSTADYSFVWRNLGTGLNVPAGNITDEGTRLLGQNLINSNYRVYITDNSTQCTNSYVSSIIASQAAPPLIDSTYTVALTNCNNPDGQAGFIVSPLQQLPFNPATNRTYTFYLQAGTSLADTLLADRSLKTAPGSATPDTVAFVSLDFGDWTSVVVDDYTHCVSSEFTVSVEQAPDLEINVLNTTSPSACSDPNGGFEIEATSTLNPAGGGGPGFNFSWDFHANNPFGPVVTPNPGTIDASTTHTETRSGLVSGYYVIDAEDLFTGCIGSDTLFLAPTPLPVIENVFLNNPDDCTPGDGEIDFQITKQAFSATLDLYTVFLYRGDKINEGNEIDSWSPPVDAPSDIHTFTGLEPGTYTFAVQEEFPDFCFSAPKDTTLVLQTPTPTLVTTSTPDFSCDGAPNPLGTLDETNLGAGEFEYIWYVGTDTSSATGTAIHGAADKTFWEPAASVNNVDQGVYTLVVRDINGANGGLGCVYKKPITVQSQIINIEITDAPLTQVTICSFDNGTIYGNEIREDMGVPFPVAGSDYQYFELFDDSFALIDSTDILPAFEGGRVDNPFDSISVGNFFLRATNVLSNCLSNPFSFEIRDISVNPDISIALTNPDFSCGDPLLFTPTGEITAGINGPGAFVDYSFEWYAGLDTAGAAFELTNVASQLTAGFFSGKKDSLYTVLVTDTNIDGVNDGCKSLRSLRVPYQTGPIIITDIVTDQTICADNGTIMVTNIAESGVNYTPAPVPPTGFESLYRVHLLDNNLNTIDFSNAYAVFDSINGIFTNIPEGTYYTTAKNLLTDCPFGQINQAVIKDVSNDPVVNITMTSPDFSCSDMATPTGELFAMAYGGSDSDATLANFSYTWNDTLGVPVLTDGGTPPTALELREGFYEVVVEDLSGVDQFCTRTRRFEVTHKLQEIIIVDASSTDQTTCVPPNGTMQVDGLLVNNILVVPGDPTFNNYTIDLYVGDLDTPTGQTDNSGLQGDPLDSLGQNTFFAIAVNNVTLCESYPRQVIVYDRSEDPIINLSKLSDNYSLNYDNSNSLTGILEAEAFEGDGFTQYLQGFTLDLYRNEVNNLDSLVSSTLLLPNAVLTETNLRDALYHLVVTSDSTGCTSTAAIDLPFVYLKPKFTPLPSAQDECVPPNGNIVINSIYKVPDSTETFNKYLFDWHIGGYDPNNPDSVKFGGNNGNRLDGLVANNYYVQALDTFWMVESDPVQVVVRDSTVFPVIQYNSSLSEDQRSCNPAFPNGALGVNVPGFDTYAYEWYDSPTATGPIISMTNSITLQDAGTYTILVRSTTTGCETERQLEIKDNIVLPILASSNSPVTNCIPELANGIANATIVNINPSSARYDFYWYEGSTATGTPAFTDLADAFNDKINSAYINIPAGFYTVVAQDTFDCMSAPLTIEIVEDLVYPAITVTELNPLTYCDPNKPNAAMSALADGKVAGYSFQWNVKNGPQYGVGPVINNLKDQVYSLIVTNNTTGCLSLRDVRPTVAYKRVPSPIVDILSERTSCVYPNGEAISSILGKLEDYRFTYLDSEGFNPITNNINGTIISELEINNYYVYATDRISGCISDSIIFEIKDARYFPEFDIITNPSLCHEATGEGEVIIADLTRDYEVRWFTESGESLGTGRTVNYQPAGQYLVEVEGTDGCYNEVDVFIGTDIIIYNGVSANFDNLNEAFYIECIDIFPNNNVKLFNRAGELIYEMDHYDSENPEKSFTGFSNRGPINGNKVAIGTYFYVVDLKDGSKPRVGYLELIR